MINVVIADDSAFLRKILKDVLTGTGKILVVGEAKNGKEAIAFVKEKKPDVLILDIEMPVMNGLEALRRIMEENPLPVFMFSSLTVNGASVTVKALEYGAVDYLLKPVSGPSKLVEIADELLQKIEAVVRMSRFKKYPKTGLAKEPTKKVLSTPAPQISSRKIDIVAIGSSTGGVQAALALAPNLPEDICPVVWVQHMPPGFTKSFADRLNNQSKIVVKEAKNNEPLERGTCYIAPGSFQMAVQKQGANYSLKVYEGGRVSGHAPSCNVLFESVAQHFSSNAIGAILTGMGDDGSDGLVKMHEKGAYIIGQDESTCVVYGMPRAAHQKGAVDIELGITDIASRISKAGGF